MTLCVLSSSHNIFTDAVSVLSTPIMFLNLRTIAESYKDGRNRTFKVILGLVTLFTLIGAIFPSSKDWFAVIPANAARMRIWTLATAGFYETTPIMGLINILILLGVGPFLCSKWGDKMFVRFIIIVNLLLFSATLLFLLFVHSTTGYDYFYFAHTCGFTGVSAAFTVALKQIIGDKPLIPTPALEALKIKHLPMASLSAAVLSWLFLGYGKELPLVMGGLFFAWLYLRFFRVDPDTNQVGDAREEFAFATLFPTFMHPFVSAVSAVVFPAMTSIGLFRNFGSADSSSSATGSKPIFDLQSVSIQSSILGTSSSSSLSSSLPTSASASSLTSLPGFSSATALPSVSPVSFASDPAAERRRQMAIKAIDAKLAALSSIPSAVASASTNNSSTNSSNANSSSASASSSSTPPAAATPATSPADTITTPLLSDSSSNS